MPLFVGASESYDTDAWEAYNSKKENAKLQDENTKLRELVDGLCYCANESHGNGRCSVRFVDGYVTYCPLYDVDSDTARCEALLRELGIEVN